MSDQTLGRLPGQTYPKLRIKDAEALTKRLGADGVVVLAFHDGVFDAASYGTTKTRCKALANWIDEIADGIENETVPSPEIL